MLLHRRACHQPRAFSPWTHLSSEPVGDLRSPGARESSAPALNEVTDKDAVEPLAGAADQCEAAPGLHPAQGRWSHWREVIHDRTRMNQAIPGRAPVRRRQQHPKPAQQASFHSPETDSQTWVRQNITFEMR